MPKPKPNPLTKAEIADVRRGLRYLTGGPPYERGGFHPNVVEIARDSLRLIAALLKESRRGR